MVRKVAPSSVPIVPSLQPADREHQTSVRRSIEQVKWQQTVEESLPQENQIIGGEGGEKEGTQVKLNSFFTVIWEEFTGQKT